MEKKCSGCEIIKDIKEFSIDRSSKDGHWNKCKVCNKKYRERNKERILEWREYNKDRKRKYDREYYEDNKIKKKDYFYEYNKKRISNDPLYKLKINIRTLIRNSLRNNGYKKGSKTNNILGCSYPELLNHLNNNEYGFVYSEVDLDIDHIVPLSKATSEEEIIKLNHYSNLQLLPADYNRHIKRDNDFNKDCLEEWLEKNNNK